MSTAAVSIETYTPFPRQAEFHACPAKYRLFGGQAGPGKSRALLEEACIQAIEVPGVETLLLRRTYPELEASILNQFRREIMVKWLGVPGFNYNESKHTVSWPNGSVTKFGYCSNEKDVYQYQGGEYLFIGVDELTMYTLKMWQFLTSRNRCPRPNTYPNMAGATNPGNIGHVWVKALWGCGIGGVKQPAPGMERADQYDPDDYAFIRATLDDNPVYANDAEYRKKLNALPTAMFRAFALGDWNIFAGQYFDNFDAAKHVIPFSQVEIKPWWPRWASIDWGFQHPASVHWHTRDGDNILTYRELFGPGIGEEELAERVVAATGKEKLSRIFLSPDAYAKRGDANTVAQQLSVVFRKAGFPDPEPADNDRVGGARLLHQLVGAGLWRISDACSKLIECLPTLIHDEDNVEDVLKVDAGEGQLGDDAYDSARYGLKSMLAPRHKPMSVEMNERVSAIPDPTARAIFAQRLQAVAAQQKQRDGYTPGRLRWQRGAQ